MWLVRYHVASADGAAIFSEPRGGGEEWSLACEGMEMREQAAASGAQVHTYTENLSKQPWKKAHIHSKYASRAHPADRVVFD